MDSRFIFEHLPLANALLNGTALGLLLSGRWLIRHGRPAAHKRVMLSAFAVSMLFLALYITHKVWRHGQITPFNGPGLTRYLYLSILVSHFLLAMLVPILAIWMIGLGLRRRLAGHRKLSRWAFPVWVYVSFTGVVIYLMLYPFNPPPPAAPAAVMQAAPTLQVTTGAVLTENR
jgi:putative membrane protein